MAPYFYKIPFERKNGNDVSGLESELKEKIIKLDQVGWKVTSSFNLMSDMDFFPG